MKKHISELMNFTRRGHEQFDFVDINILDDQALFIDPCLLMNNQDEWCERAIAIVNSFFDKFFEAYSENDYNKKKELLAHAREINYTRLGYGNGGNGHGNSAEGLIDMFGDLDNLVTEIPFISQAMDIPVYVEGFNEDGLSDMLTNILHEHLNSYTMQQLELVGIQANAVDTYYTWDMINLCWKEITSPCFKYLGNAKILLTPKRIVNKKYSFGVNQFLSRIILERAKNETAYTNEKGKLRYRVTKKELQKNIEKVDKNWRFKYTKDKSRLDPTYLRDYHNAIPRLYMGKQMTDEELDSFIY